MYNARLFCGTKCSVLHRGGKPGTNISYHRRSRSAHVVSGLSTARKPRYIFSPDFVQIATFLSYNASAPPCLFWVNAECICRRRFHYSLSSALFLSKGASEGKINFGYEYFCFGINLSTFFFQIFFSKFFFQIFFSKFFFQIFFSKFFFQIFFSTFFFQIFF